MLVKDHGQPSDQLIAGVRCLSTFKDGAGLPAIRFMYPKIFSIWRALDKANADIYYQSCADMLTGVVAAYCKLNRKKFIYRLASDKDAEPDLLKIRFARDRALYKWGLRNATVLMAQTEYQHEKLKENFSLSSPIVKMIVEAPTGNVDTTIDVLWVGNIRPVKRADRLYQIAKSLPKVSFCVVGGAVPGFEKLHKEISSKLSSLNNVTVLGLVPYKETEKYYCSCKILTNTSDMEGFPNSFLQAWAAGKPIVSMFDPDGLIDRLALGSVVSADEDFAGAIKQLLDSKERYNTASNNALQYIDENHSEAAVVESIVDVIANMT
jgi:glycosyltransferase involved in cell wall biosynthesis